MLRLIQNKLHNSDKPVDFVSLDVIISVGYRVKSISSKQFRIWENERIIEYLIKGVGQFHSGIEKH